MTDAKRFAASLLSESGQGKILRYMAALSVALGMLKEACGAGSIPAAANRGDERKYVPI